MSKVTPRVNIAFKKLFGVEENKDLLISLINSIVSNEDQVADITLLNPYNNQNFANQKLSILDIKAKSLIGQMFNIEIQIADTGDYDKRALYYWAKLYTEQIEQAEKYSSLNKAIGIHILNFTSIVGSSKYHHTFHLKEKDTNIHFFKDIELHTIELNKFTPEELKGRYLTKEEELKALLPRIKTSLDKWLAFLTRHNILDKQNLPQELNDPKLEKALGVLDIMNLDKVEREIYEGHLKWLRDEESALAKSEEKGRVIGIEEGIAIGIAEVAKALLSTGQDINYISQVTGLSIAQIKQLLSDTK